LQRSTSFVVGVLFEAALLLVALAWGAIFGDPVFDQCRWSASGCVFGLIAAFPVFALFVWTLNSRLQCFVRHRQVLDSVIPKMFADWSLWQLAAISLCAGICEEALFRGAIQSSLTGRVGLAASVILVSLLFGALHLLSWTYGVIAGLIGAYLGWLLVASGNLLVPMLTHAFYDFLALLYYLKIHRRV
jgi:hypothetical protein